MSSPQVSALGGSYNDADIACSRIQLRRSITLVVMTLLVPGSAQLAQGNRSVGRIAVRIWLTLIGVVAVIGLIALTSRGTFLALATSPFLLKTGQLVLYVLALGWALLLLDAIRLGQPLRQRVGHRVASTALGALVTVMVAGSLTVAANAVGVVNDFSGEVFTATTVSKPHDGRYNVLLLGTDSGKDRVGMRPDSINVASVDAETGRAVLIGLPRNLEDVPFPAGSVMAEQFPDGFNCDGCYLNAVNTWAEDHKELFGDSEEPGIDATIDAVSEITGLQINYYAMVNMKGFARLIDSAGGVRINVRERTAIGGIGSPIRGWIEQGEQQLTGDQALWYARSRVMNDDWSRMGRQKCVMQAMVQQLSPEKVVLNMREIADSSSAMLHTSVPRQDMSRFMELALKTKNQPISSVSLVPPVIYTGNPDYPKVRRLVAEAVAEAEAGDGPRAALATAELGPVDLNPKLKDPRKANQSKDLANVC